MSCIGRHSSFSFVSQNLSSHSIQREWDKAPNAHAAKTAGHKEDWLTKQRDVMLVIAHHPAPSCIYYTWLLIISHTNTVQGCTTPSTSIAHEHAPQCCCSLRLAPYTLGICLDIDSLAWLSFRFCWDQCCVTYNLRMCYCHCRMVVLAIAWSSSDICSWNNKCNTHKTAYYMYIVN